MSEKIITTLIKTLRLAKNSQYIIFIPKKSGLELSTLNEIDERLGEMNIHAIICLVNDTAGIKVLKQSPTKKNKKKIIEPPKPWFKKILR